MAPDRHQPDQPDAPPAGDQAASRSQERVVAGLPTEPPVSTERLTTGFGSRSTPGALTVQSRFEPLAQSQIDRLPGMEHLARALGPGEPAQVLQIDWPSARPQCVRVAIERPRLRVRSFRFARELEADLSLPPGKGPLPQRQSSVSQPEAHPAAAGDRRASAGVHPLARIRPPDDVIKLPDRLHYVLQPPVELLLADRSLALPAEPFAFQFQGIAFLYPRQSAILADEMGLGKTMQAITAVRLLVRRGELRSVLLVCPKPLVPSWQREFERWAPELPVMVISGSPAQRAWQWRLAGVPVRIANYELLCRDEAVLLGHDCAEADEAPAGNAGTNTDTNAVADNNVAHDAHKRPRQPHAEQPACGYARSATGCRESARGERASLALPQFDLVVLDEAQRIKNPQGATNRVVRAVARKRSWALTGTPVENGPQDLVGIFEFVAPGLLRVEMKPRQMGRLAGDYVLRRTKDQVLDQLPPKWFRDAELELSPEQRESYELAEQEGVLRLAHLGRELTIRHVFELIVRLKQICNFDPATGVSAKLDRLLADLEEVAQSGRKALVFSQWVETLRRLARHLAAFRPLEYHGRIPPSQREDTIRRFHQDPDCRVMLLTYGAGGVGLNLQMANYVFLFDRWWNPAVEDQAINRAHRIGVCGPVIVTRFLTLGTIEQRIDQLLQQKRELFEIIMSGAEARGQRALSPEELFGLFDLDYPGTSRRAA